MNRVASTFALAAALAACENTPTLRFQVDKQIPQQTIDGSLAPCQIAQVFPFLQAPLQMTFSQQQDFPEQNTDVQRITSAKLDTLTLTVTSGEPNWDFLETLDIFVEADGLSTELVAVLDPVPDGATTITLQPTGLQLAPYVKAPGGFTMTSEATGCPPAQDTTFTGQVILNIAAEPL